MREIYVLGRRHGVRTNLNNTLSSAHCPECGAPLSSAFAVTCNYCNTVLNEGSNSWILEQITGENDPAYLEIIAAKVANEKDFAEDNATRSARDVITIMAQILLSDGKAESSEMQLLNKIALHHEMSETQVKAIINSLKEGLVYIPAPADNREAWSLLMAAARMALADGIISPEEERELVLLAQHIGYCAADVARAIKAEEKRRFEEKRAIKYRINREKLNLELAKNKAREPEDPDDSQ
jgi:tellurite resistance protein